MRGSRRHLCRGLTLPELLVSIAVLSVLALVVAGVFPNLQRQAAVGTCLGRIRNLNNALLLHVQDQNGVFPALETPEYRNAGNGIWFKYAILLLPYLGLSEEEAKRVPHLFSCPLVNNNVNTPSYIFSAANQYDPKYPGMAGARLSLVAQPSRTITLVEVSAVFPTSWHYPGSTNIFNGARNVAAFADGHAACFPFHYDGAALSISSDPPAGFDYRWSPY